MPLLQPPPVIACKVEDGGVKIILAVEASTRPGLRIASMQIQRGERMQEYKKSCKTFSQNCIWGAVCDLMQIYCRHHLLRELESTLLQKYAILPEGLTLMRISSLWFGFWCRSVYDICTWSAPIWKVDAIYISSMIYWYMMRPNNIEIQIPKKNFLFNFILLYSHMIYARSERVHMSTQHWTLATLLFDLLEFLCFEFRDLLSISS